jgi:hypothetical protein
MSEWSEGLVRVKVLRCKNFPQQRRAATHWDRSRLAVDLPGPFFQSIITSHQIRPEPTTIATMPVDQDGLMALPFFPYRRRRFAICPRVAMIHLNR